MRIKATLAALLIAILPVGVFVAPVAVEAQRQGKVAKIGVLALSNPASAGPYLEALREGLRELGYVEGQNIALETRFARNHANLLPALAADLVHLRVDVIFAANTQTLKAARQATNTIPIVMVVEGDPIADGFVASPAQPGGNITGLALLSPEVTAKGLELLKEAVPKLSRVAVLIDSRRPSGEVLGALRRAAQTLGLALDTFEVRDADTIKTAFTAIKKARAGGLLVAAALLPLVHRAQAAEFATANRLPSISQPRSFAYAGGLMTYGPPELAMYRRAATYVDKILKGAKPADLPVEQPTKFELVINLKTATALGLTIPQSLLLRADAVIR